MEAEAYVIEIIFMLILDKIFVYILSTVSMEHKYPSFVTNFV